MFDLIIRDGNIVDGTGSPAFGGDVAVADGVIVEIGKVDGSARQVVDAAGALVAPGWVDGHTHYDGQVTWDDRLEGSASNGVTTVVMGNCGVGFAPVKAADVAALIDLMEGVEAIPGTALYEGMPWGSWETFPEYLNFLDQRKWSLDVGTQIPHGALRFYVMGERAIHDADATADELSVMGELVEEAVRAGALGFSTSRMQGHRSMSGFNVPGTFAAETEVLAIARALAAGGGAVFQAISANGGGDIPGQPLEKRSFIDELRLFGRISRDAGVPFMYTLLQVNSDPVGYRDSLKVTAEENALGAQLIPMCSSRGFTVLSSWSTYHPFSLKPTYQRLAKLPHEQLVAELRRPEIKARILHEPNVPILPAGLMENIQQPMLEAVPHLTYPLENPLDYEPGPEKSIEARAAKAGRETFEYYYDFLLENDGRAVAMAVLANYADGNFDAAREMIVDPQTVLGNSDAGAHVNFISDASMPTFQISHWVRDRSRGATVPLEVVVKKGTSGVAEAYGMHDRGAISIGKRADINVIDYENLSNDVPLLHRDLPAGGARFLQSANGYIATFVRGVQTRANDEDTGARPGRVARRSAPV